MRAAVVLATLALLASSSLADVDDAAAPSPARAPNPGEDPASTSGPGGFPTKTDVSLMRWISAKGGAFVGDDAVAAQQVRRRLDLLIRVGCSMPLAFVQCVVVVLLDVKEVLVRGHGWRLDDDAPRRVFVHFF